MLVHKNQTIDICANPNRNHSEIAEYLQISGFTINTFNPVLIL